MTAVFVLAGLAGVLALLVPACAALRVPGFRDRLVSRAVRDLYAATPSPAPVEPVAELVPAEPIRVESEREPVDLDAVIGGDR